MMDLVKGLIEKVTDVKYKVYFGDSENWELLSISEINIYLLSHKIDNIRIRGD